MTSRRGDVGERGGAQLPGEAGGAGEVADGVLSDLGAGLAAAIEPLDTWARKWASRR